MPQSTALNQPPDKRKFTADGQMPTVGNWTFLQTVRRVMTSNNNTIRM